MEINSIIAALDKWQNLSGAALGPFLAVILSSIAYLIGSKYREHKERREAYRRTEIALTITLNEIYSTREKLRNFISRLRGLSASINSIKDETTYSLEEINFPSIKKIFVEDGFPYRRFGSYYLHNKLLESYSGIESTNNIIEGLKEDFKSMVKKSELLAGMKARPQEQRTAYAENLENFSRAISGFLPYIDEGIKILTQCKIYNLKFLNKKKMFIWKHEGITLKYFNTMADIAKYCQHLDCLDRIDKIIEKEVQESIAEAEERHKQNLKKV